MIDNGDLWRLIRKSGFNKPSAKHRSFLYLIIKSSAPGAVFRRFRGLFAQFFCQHGMLHEKSGGKPCGICGKKAGGPRRLPRAGWPPLWAGPLKLRAFPYPDPSLKQAANSWRTLCAATGGGTAGLLQFFSGFVRRGTCSLGKAVICLIR